MIAAVVIVAAIVFFFTGVILCFQKVVLGQPGTAPVLLNELKEE